MALWVENNLGTEVLRDVAGVVGISNLLLTLASGVPGCPCTCGPSPFLPHPGRAQMAKVSALPLLWAYIPDRCPSVFASSLESLFEIDSVLPRN